MKPLNYLLILSLIFVFNITLSCSSDDGDPPPPPPPPPKYPKTINLNIKSNYAFDNYTYPVTIWIPNSNKNLPIVYVLDGKLNMERAKGNRPSNQDAIFVGIGDFAANGDWQRRWQDLMPENSQCFSRNGKHKDFYNFITNQVIQIENTENLVPESRTLMGHSSAGLFSVVSLFMEDSENVIFHNFIASDPELGCDLTYFTNMLHDFELPANTIKLYMALSNEGTIDEVREFSEILESKEYSWLTFKYEEFLNQDHMGVIDPSFRSGLKFLFE